MAIAQKNAVIVPLELAPERAPLRLLWVPPGGFRMGSERHGDDPEARDPVVDARLTRGCWIGQYPVTRAQWAAVRGTPAPPTGSEELPRTGIDWHDARKFAKALNTRYRKLRPPGYVFGLPTEQQWERACRGELGSEPLEPLHQFAWYLDNSGDQIQPVGRKRPNEWGFCDMVGNVGEWCLDAAAPYDPKSMVDRAVTKRSALKCVRGGTYRASLEGGTLGCDCRGWAESTVRRPWFGVRIALRPRVGLIGR